MQSKNMFILAVSYVSLILAAIMLATSWSIQAKSAPAESPAFVRIVHASPDVGTADVFLDGAKALSNFQFGTVTNYLSIPPGPHKVQVALIGKGARAAVITQMLTVKPGVVYTVAALGRRATGLFLEVFSDSNLVSPGKAKVRFYHLSPGTGSVDVSTNGNSMFSGLIYQQASDYVTISAGSYTFNVDVTQPSTSESTSLKLQANTVTSVFVVGLIGGTPQIQFVSAQVVGLPGMPPTGSDPRPIAAPASPLPLNPWQLAALVLLILGAGMLTRHKQLARRGAATHARVE